MRNREPIVGLLIAAAIFGAPVLVIANVNGWLIFDLAASLIAAALGLTRLDPLSFGPTMVTVGDLARQTALQNYGILAGQGGRADAQTIWEALVEVTGACSEYPPSDKIERGAVILQSQFEEST